jgi:hypothetical protein
MKPLPFHVVSGFLVRNSLIIRGLVFPPEACIALPLKNLIALLCPARKSAKAAGCSLKTLSISESKGRCDPKLAGTPWNQKTGAKFCRQKQVCPDIL